MIKWETPVLDLMLTHYSNEGQRAKTYIANESRHVTFSPLRLGSSSVAAWGLSEAPNPANLPH